MIKIFCDFCDEEIFEVTAREYNEDDLLNHINYCEYLECHVCPKCIATSIFYKGDKV
jgi:hypothetical protein